MSVRRKLLLASFGFVTIVLMLGLLTRQQTVQLGRVIIAIHDHAVVGMSYADDTQAHFLRMRPRIDVHVPFAEQARQAEFEDLLDRLDVAIERAGSDRTRAAALDVRAMLATLPDLSPSDLASQLAQIDHAIEHLVKDYVSDALQARDNADDEVARGDRLLIIEVTLAAILATCLGWLLGNNLAPPLMALVRTIGRLTEGDVEARVAPRLEGRRDEIGAVARATSFFREAMFARIAEGEARVRLEAEHAAAQHIADRSREEVRAKSDFLATMSHEIRTPMNGVATVADLLADTRLSEDQLKMVNIIRQSSKWLLRVINDILDFSKLEVEQLHVESVPFMLDEVIESACHVLAAKAREKNLALVVEGQDLPEVCRIGDPLRLRQVLLNLLGNAVKFTDAGSVRLVLQAAPDGIALRVIDTGIGIPADKIGNLFQPYNQLRSDAARSYGGTGLGLSITRNLITLMGGRLEVTSESGQGSCFAAILPLPSDAASRCKRSGPNLDPRVRWRKPDLAMAARQAAVVLCAEDNAINRDVLARVLDSLGFNHEIVEDGSLALARLDRRKHAVLLTDAQMPVLDGWQLAQAVRRQEADAVGSRLPIILLTANALSERDGRALGSGIDSVLTKPLDRRQLEATLLAAAPALGALRIADVDDPPPQVTDAQADAPPPMHLPPMHLPPMHLHPVDLRVLADLVGDDPDDIAGLLDDFRGNALQQHAGIQAAQAAGDMRELAAQAHALKGASRYAGVRALAEICDALEQRAKHGADLSADLAALATAMGQLPAALAAALDHWRAAHQVTA